ncbi:MAG: M24 family metallopeptidase [Xanthomonadales bacterium]|nr:M24 family metallopeptidase [Xanthomonadales bacterium]
MSRSLLIDAGAQVRGYAADITRTHVRDGHGPFAELLAGMERLQQRLVAGVRPGRSFVELHLEAHREIASLLADSGLVRGMAAEAVVESGISRAFFPHGLGHLLGLQVHDVAGHQQDAHGTPTRRPPEHPFLRLTRILEEDMVLTIEPGLYFIPALLAELAASPAGRAVDWALVERLRPYGGIRIEDDVRVTASGCENLTRAAFAALAGAP